MSRFNVKMIHVNASVWLVPVPVPCRRWIALQHRGRTLRSLSSDISATRRSWTALQRANNGPWNSSISIIVLVVIIHRRLSLRRFVVVRTVPDVNQLVAARIFAVVQLPVRTCPLPALRYDHHADEDDDEGTQHRTAQQRRHYSRVEHYTSGRQPTMRNRAKMVHRYVAVDDSHAQSDARRQRLSTGVRRSDCHSVTGVHVVWRQSCG